MSTGKARAKQIQVEENSASPGGSLQELIETRKILPVATTESDGAMSKDDKVKLQDLPPYSELAATLEGKVDKVTGKGLSDENYTSSEKTKLSNIATEATKNRPDSENADKEHTHTTNQVNGLDAVLDSKVDKQTGKGLSDTNFTQAEKDKLSSLESSKFVGLFVSESALPSSGSEGDYANVDGGIGSDVYRVIWDSNDNKWVKLQGVSTELTDAQIKQQYESNPDTNAFTDDEKSKLSGIASEATKNRPDSENADKVHTHTMAQVTGLDDALDSKASKTELTDGLGSKVDKVSGKQLSDANFTQAEKTKLSSIASEATKNRSDGENADKVHTHTTDQVTGLDSALSGKVDKETGKGLIEPAPVDGKQYARKDDAWVEVTGDVEEAPEDGKQYARKNAGWEEVVSGGTQIQWGTITGNVTLTHNDNGKTFLITNDAVITVDSSLPVGWNVAFVPDDSKDSTAYDITLAFYGSGSVIGNTTTIKGTSSLALTPIAGLFAAAGAIE